MEEKLRFWKRIGGIGGLAMATGLLAAGPEKPKAAAAATKSAQAKPALIATFKGGQVTAEEVQKEIDRRAVSVYFRRQLQKPAGRRRFVEGIIRSKVLAVEARNRGLDKDPAVRARIDAILSAELQKRLRQERAPAAASDAEARKYYDDHKSEFERPERKKISQIFLKLAPNAPAEDRAAKLTAAQEIMDELKKAQPGKQAIVFGKLAATKSEDPLGRRYRGTYGYIYSGMTPSARYPREVIDAVAKLTGIGQISDIVKAADGLHILLLERVIPARKQTFDQAKSMIKARLRSRRLTDITQLAADVFKKVELKINEDALAALKVPAPSPRTSPRYPKFLRKKPPVIRPVGPKPPAAPGIVKPAVPKPVDSKKKSAKKK